MKFNINPQWAPRALVAALVATTTMFVPGAAGAASSTTATAAIVKNADTYVNNIRTYFFCASSKCKKNHASEARAAAQGMAALVAQANAAESAAVPVAERAVVAQFVTDVRSLDVAYVAYPKQSAAADIARNTGLLYYQSADIGTDTYLLSVDVNAGKAAYVPWSVGPIAVLYAMQLDTSALNAKSATVADDIYASQNLEHEATSLLSHANGPNANFNALLISFATTQKSVSANEILILEKKPATLSDSKLKSLSALLASRFKQIVAMQASLTQQASG